MKLMAMYRPWAVALLIFISNTLGTSLGKRLSQHMDETLYTSSGYDQNFYINLGAEYETYAVNDVSNRWGSLSEAIACFEKAVLVSGDHTQEAHMSLGRLYASVGRLDEALVSYGVAVELATDLSVKATAIGEKAKLLIGMARGEEAIPLLLTALKYNTNQLSLYLPLVLLYEDVKSLLVSDWKAMIQKIEIAIEQQVRRKGIFGDSEWGRSSSNSVGRDVYWALCEAYDVIGEYSEAWKYLEKAQKYMLDFQARLNKGSSRRFRDNIEPEGVLLHHILSNVANETMKKGRSNKIETPRTDPVFLVGMPRSGVEAMGLILCSHRDIFCDGEDSIFSGIEFSNLKRSIIAAHLGAAPETDVGTVLSRFRDSFLNKSYGQLRGGRYQQFKILFLDTYLTNYRNIHLIKQTFPSSIIIHVVRDPMDTLLSCFRYQYHNLETEWVVNGADLLEEYIGYLKAMNYYRNFYGDSILDVNYEALCTNTESVLRIVVEAIGATWNGQAGIRGMPYNNSVLYSFVSKNFLRVQSEMGRHAVGSWKNYAAETLNIRNHILKKLSDFHESKSVIPFAGVMNWELSQDFNYSIPPSPGVILPSRKKSTRKKKKKKVLSLETQDISASHKKLSLPAYFHPQPGQHIYGSGEDAIPSQLAIDKKRRFKALDYDNVQVIFSGSINSNETSRLRLRRPQFSLLSRYSGEMNIKKQTLPSSKKRRHLLSFHEQIFLKGAHSFVVLNSMKKSLGLRLERSINISSCIDDIISVGFSFLFSTLLRGEENATQIFKEIISFTSKDKMKYRNQSLCLSDVGINLAGIVRANRVLAYIHAHRSPHLWSPRINSVNLADATRLLMYRGDYEEAASILKDGLSRDFYRKTPSRLLGTQAAVLFLKLGEYDKALKHIEKIEKAFPAMLQTKVLRLEVFFATGAFTNAISELSGAMIADPTIASDKYIEENSRFFDISKLSSAWQEVFLFPFSFNSLSRIYENCYMAAAGSSSISAPIRREPLISLERTLSYLQTIWRRSHLIHPDMMYLLSLVGNDGDLNVQAMSVLAVYNWLCGRSDMAVIFLNRLLDLLPDDELLLLAAARNKATNPDEYLSVIDIMEHAILVPDCQNAKLWFYREVLYFWSAHMDTSLGHNDIHNRIPAYILNGLGADVEGKSEIDSRKLVSIWNITALKHLREYQSLKATSQTKDGLPDGTAVGSVGTNTIIYYSLKVAIFASEVSQYTFLRSRQVAAIGFASIEIARVLKNHLNLLKSTGNSLIILGRIPTNYILNGVNVSEHAFSFFDLLNLARKWLQFVDIFEPIMYATDNDNQFKRVELLEGKYENMAFISFRTVVIENFHELSHLISHSQIRDHLYLISTSKNFDELCTLAGVDCTKPMKISVKSSAKKDFALPGYELIVVEDGGRHRVGYRTLQNSVRSQLYFTELEFIFERIVAAASNGVYNDGLLSLVVDFYYYMIHLSPFQIGNSQIGIAIISAVVLISGDIFIPDSLAKSEVSLVQLEWEAMLSKDIWEFRDIALLLLSERMSADNNMLLQQEQWFETPRDILQALNTASTFLQNNYTI